MVAQETVPPVASSSTEPHRMRITSGGSIASYLKFSLNFLQVRDIAYVFESFEH